MMTDLGGIRIEVAARKTLDVLVVEELESGAVLGHDCKRVRMSSKRCRRKM